jgi:ribosomal protein S18 acetylase RimI-like enzyme
VSITKEAIMRASSLSTRIERRSRLRRATLAAVVPIRIEIAAANTNGQPSSTAPMISATAPKRREVAMTKSSHGSMSSQPPVRSSAWVRMSNNESRTLEMTDRPQSDTTSELKYAYLAGSRPLRVDDVDRIVEINQQAFAGHRPIDPRRVLASFENPGVDDARRRCVLERQGLIIGFGSLRVADGEVTLECAAPGSWTPFLEWAEATARLNGVSRVRAVSYAGTELPETAAARGYHLGESNYTMEARLEEAAPLVSPLPEGIRLSTYREADAEHLRLALNEVFAEDPFFDEVALAEFAEQYVQVPGMDPSLWLLAWHDQELAAFLVAYPDWAGDRSIGFIHSLGVRSGWRARGLGESIARHALEALHARDLRAVRLGVEAPNTTAFRLYERLGMRVISQVDHWVLELGD